MLRPGVQGHLLETTSGTMCIAGTETETSADLLDLEFISGRFAWSCSPRRPCQGDIPVPGPWAHARTRLHRCGICLCNKDGQHTRLEMASRTSRNLAAPTPHGSEAPYPRCCPSYEVCIPSHAHLPKALRAWNRRFHPRCRQSGAPRPTRHA